MVRSDEGMSSSTKIILAVLAAGGVLALICCGGLAWWGNRVFQDFKQEFEESIAEMDELGEVYIDDPVQVAEMAATIIEIRVPPRYAPSFGTDHTSAEILRRQVTYTSGDDLGGIVIREMTGDDITTRDEAARILAGELAEEGWVYEFEPTSTSQRTFTISGEECVFEFRAGTDPDTGDDMRQAAGVVPSDNGLAYLLAYDTAANWDEAAIVAMIESIRIGRPRPAVESTPAISSPDAATPTETPPESAAETPAESKGGTPDTPGAATTTPQ